MLACAGALAACSGSDGADGAAGASGLTSAVRTSDVAPGDECVAGGVRIEAGIDDNGNGVLEDGEVDGSSLICAGVGGTPGAPGDDGAPGAPGGAGDPGDDGLSALTVLTAIEPLDPNCPSGGVRVDTGIDDDGDGELDEAEIDATEYVCNGASFINPESYAAPEGPPGAYRIDLSGGDGTTNTGGDGGDVEIEMDYGSIGGHIKIFATGVADASWDYPETVGTYLGTEPLVVSSDLEIPSLPDGDHGSLSAGDAHTHLGSGDRVYIWDGTEDTIVTGIRVAAGATLTFGHSETSDPPNVSISLDNDFHNAGTVTTEVALRGDGSLARAGLSLYVDSFVGEAGSMIDLHGPDGAVGSDGADGGNLYIDASDGDWSTTQDLGAVFNRGSVDTSGGDGANGGDAGSININGELSVLNTGILTAVGGDGTGASGRGGNGGAVDLDADYGNCFNSAAIDASGGDGTTVGGSGGDIELYIGYPGHIRNTGTLTTEGGDAGAGCTGGACSGGSGGDVDFTVYGGDIITSADVSTRGGLGAGGPGGSGGDVDFDSSYDNGWYGDYMPLGDIIVSGNYDQRGGAGASGGSGGDFTLELDVDYVPDNQEIILLGYTAIDTSGGNSTGSGGGDGGYVWVENDYADSDVLDYGPSGGVVNHVPITTRGGNGGGTGNGGDAGCIEFFTDDEYGYATDSEFVINFGNLNARGGDGASGGDGGCVKLWGMNHAENHGDIDATGGDASAVGGQGGAGARPNDYNGDGDYGVYVLTDLGPAINTGSIDTSGGDGKAENGDGGDAELVEIVGLTAENSGDITAAGGEGGASGTDSYGGDGSLVFLYGVYDGSTNSGTLNVDGGAGATEDGDDGEVVIDGANVTDDWL